MAAIAFVWQASADVFSSPKVFWMECGKNPISAPAECSGKGFLARMKEMCASPSDKSDCTKLYQAYSARTLQSEAKNTLEILYTQEQSHMVRASRYTDNFESVWTGAIKDPKKAFYIYSVKSCNNGGTPTTSLQFGWQLRPEIAADTKTLLSQLSKTLSDLPCPKLTEFTLVAVGKVSAFGQPDIWLIDQSGKLRNIQNGIPDPFK